MFTSYPETRLGQLQATYDYIIIGGGTAGCVLANRLSTNPNVTVLLVEQGGVSEGWSARNPFFSFHHVSDGSRSLVTPSVPQPHVGDRVFDLIRGRVLGGTSKVNATLYSRGCPGEYNAWSRAGRMGWSYDEIEKYFVRAERALDLPAGEVPKYHGATGEWSNRSYIDKPYWRHTPHIIKAAAAMGIPYVDDLNSPTQSPSCCARVNISIDRRGERCSTSSAFLPASLVKNRRSRLHVCTNTMGVKVEIGHDGQKCLRATGVHLQIDTDASQSRLVGARKEVILSSGAFGSPKVLLLSGIGPATHLKKHDIPVVYDLVGVGSHLQDHLAVAAICFIPFEDSIVKLLLSTWHMILYLLGYILFGVSPYFAPEVALFVQSRLFDPDFTTMTSSSHDDAALPENIPDVELIPAAWADPDACRDRNLGGFSLMTSMLHPTSTGTVRLASADPAHEPLIDPNYLSTEDDRILARRSVTLIKRMLDRIAAEGYPITNDSLPDLNDAAAVDEFVWRSSMTSFHYASSCRMAPEAEGGVVDDRLRVHGVRGLRVANTSICPRVPATHTAAVAVMIAEKCSDMVRADNGDSL